jgi:hypothetical protein
MSLVRGVSDESVSLTTNTVDKRLFLLKQEIQQEIGLRRGQVSTYDLTTRSGTATIDNKTHPFKAVDTTIAVGDQAVFQRLTNGDQSFVLLGVIL